jgi:hypothetical protein
MTIGPVRAAWLTLELPYRVLPDSSSPIADWSGAGVVRQYEVLV